MNIVADRNIPFVVKAFAPFGEVTALPTTAITRDAVRRADALIIRSETKVTAPLLEGSRVRFIGSASIGTDHADLDELADRGIVFANAPGCNADSVKEYIAAALLHIAREKSFALRGAILGIVGAGSVGRKVASAASGLGLTVLLNDPPRARDEGPAGFVSLDDAMAADIVTLHVPLTRSGEDATYHLFDAGRLARMKRGSVLVNASRGAVVDSRALLRALTGGHPAAAVLDVWEGEPDIDYGLLARVPLGTAHVAGYSMEGKANAVRLIREAFCRHFGLDAPWDPAAELPPPEVREIEVGSEVLPAEDVLRRVVSACYDIRVDDKLLRRGASLPAEKRPDYFRGLRAGYRPRREFSNVTVRLPRIHEGLKSPIAALGFKVTKGC
jgi:erythronate-4-phosphate dehydrogenase